MLESSPQFARFKEELFYRGKQGISVFRKLIRMPLLTLSLLLSLLLLLLLMPIGFGPSGLVLVLVLLLLETYRERKKSVNKGTKEGEEGTTRSDLRRPLPALVGTFCRTSGVPMLSEGLLELE